MTGTSKCIMTTFQFGVSLARWVAQHRHMAIQHAGRDMQCTSRGVLHNSSGRGIKLVLQASVCACPCALPRALCLVQYREPCWQQMVDVSVVSSAQLSWQE